MTVRGSSPWRPPYVRTSTPATKRGAPPSLPRCWGGRRAAEFQTGLNSLRFKSKRKTIVAWFCPYSPSNNNNSNSSRLLQIWMNRHWMSRIWRRWIVSRASWSDSWETKRSAIGGYWRRGELAWLTAWTLQPWLSSTSHKRSRQQSQMRLSSGSNSLWSAQRLRFKKWTPFQRRTWRWRRDFR